MDELVGKLTGEGILLLDDDDEISWFEKGRAPLGRVFERARVETVLRLRSRVFTDSLEPLDDLGFDVLGRRVRSFEKSNQQTLEAAGGFRHLGKSEAARSAYQTVNRPVERPGTVLAPAIFLQRVPLLHQRLQSARQLFEEVGAQSLQLLLELFGRGTVLSITFHRCPSRFR